MRFGLSIPPFTEPAALVELIVAAERSGWDGAFLWEHVVGTPDFPVPVAEPWVVLGAAAQATERIRLGTTITALPRRLVQEVARQTVTLDHLSDGRVTLGVGLGEPPWGTRRSGARPTRRSWPTCSTSRSRCWPACGGPSRSPTRGRR